VNSGAIDRARHRTAKRIDLFREMALANTADRRIAAHLPERLEVVGQKQRARAGPRGGQGCLGPSMTATDDNAIKDFRGTHDRKILGAAATGRQDAVAESAQVSGGRAAAPARNLPVAAAFVATVSYPRSSGLVKRRAAREHDAAMVPARFVFVAAVLALAPLAANAELVLEPCRLEVPRLPSVAADCGRLTVPEDPDAPDGRAIELFVARVPSLSPDPQPDPLVVIAGGPGQAASRYYVTSRAAFENIRRDRAIVIVDQRGTGNSAPLVCPDVNASSLARVEAETLPALMRACLAALVGDPRLYTTSVAVVDLDTVRAALGVEQWNLYGVSYGTRVAQHYLRRFPARARALIFDGVLPSDAALGPDMAINAQRALDRVLARCAEDPACSSQFPDTADALTRLLTDLDAAPIELTLADPTTGQPRAVASTGDDMRAVIRLLSYSPQTAALLPLLVDAARAGNVAPLAAQYLMLTAEIESELSLPMHNAVVCTEDVPFFPSLAPVELAATYLGTSVFDALSAACSVWPVGERDDVLREPVVAEQPVLILSGEADPITPPEYGQRVATSLVNVRHIVGAGQGHGLAGVGCMPRLMREFLDRLEPAALDASCLERTRRTPFFLDFSGPAP
jgi:pimeloyl-ACP methyl ester carboxylesterase